MLLAVLFLAVSVFAEQPQALAPDWQVPDNFSIPARLSKAIDTNKCKPGDAVELQTLEPLLITTGLVMPENAKLHGRVLGGASRQDNRPSWVVLVVERAEWKHHDIPLHAFVAAQITVNPNPARQPEDAFKNRNYQLRPSGRQRGAPGAGTVSPSSLGPADAMDERTGARQSVSPGIQDLRMVTSKDGVVFLVSQKPHLKLPSGTMFVLRNQVKPSPEQLAATKAPGASK